MTSLASSSQSPIPKRPPGMTQLNESVWELYSPSNGAVPEVEIVFFHGLQLSDYQDAFWKTWLSRDQTVVWPKDWLSQRFPKARILSISYDSSLRKLQGEPDPYVITENLIHNMIQSDDARVGQNCPVILVGHSFGGIVIKEFVLGCNRRKVELSRVRSQVQVDRLNKFLGNCSGVFYYSTPHSGSRIADYADLIPGINRPLVNLLKTLSTETARINETFAQARDNLGIKTHAIGESLKTNYMWLSAKVVEEASARNDIDGIFYTAPEANHFDVCKAKDNKTCGIFKHLVTFVDDILQSDKKTVGEDGDECQGLPNYPVELDSRARDIEKLLLGKSVIGISGMGGIGKTTVAKKVYNDISQNFDYTCFAENVKGIRDLGDWLLCHFHGSGTRMEGAQKKWSDFKGRRTMIVLDDVDSTDQISVLPKLHHFGEGSRIILTSRDGGIFKYFDDFELYEVKLLKADEAKKLFCRHAFDIQEIPNYATKLKENVEAVVEKCNGLPLTLEVIGRYLRNENNAKVWEETIDKLRRAESIDGGQNDRVWASLRVSYETLAKEEQAMFIEAGTYFFGKKLNVAFAAWSSISANPETRWTNLVRRSMVKENQDKTVWVHEHLRALSWTLTKGDVVSSSDENVDKVTGVDELVGQLNAKQVNLETKILKLQSLGVNRTLKLQRIAELEKLKYLDLDEVETKGPGKNLLSTLSLLRWKRRVPSKSQLPITLIPRTSLAVLELEYGDVPKGFLEALSNLTNLRYLSLSGLEGLDHLPENFSNLSRLKYLHLASLRLRSLPESLGNLAALEHLELRGLDVSDLPDSFGTLSKLVSLKIDYCEKLDRLPSSFGPQLTSLEELSITYSRLLECLPDSFSQLSSLQQLSLRGCWGLKELEASFGNLSVLKDLDLSHTGIRRLPGSFSKLSGLERLSLSHCESLKEWGDSFGNLSALKDLDLSHIGDSFSQLERQELGDSFGNFKSALKYLDLSYTLIGRLPESFGCLSALEKLSCKFDQARLLPDNFCHLISLRELSIESRSLERLPDNLGELVRLEKLDLTVHNVSALPTSMGQLASLQNVSICSAKLEKLPDSFEKLSSLKRLSILAKTSVGILSSIGPLSSLQTLHVNEYTCYDFAESGDDNLDCDDSMEKLRDLFGKLCSLRDMDIDCGNLKELPDSLGKLSSLEHLKIVGRKLESLPQSIGQLRSLRTMELKVPRIRCLPESMNKLSSLRKFSFKCNGHGRLPDHFEHLPFPSLAVVLQGSSGVPEGIGRLSSLQDLTLDFDLTSLPEELGELKSLQALKISCSELVSLPDSLGRLSSLRELHLEQCYRLKSLPDSLGRPSSSQRALPHGAVRNDEEPSSQTPDAGANSSELTVDLYECPILNELRMRSLGWVPYGFGGKYRRMPDNIPLGCVVVQSTRALCYIAIFSFLLRKFYYAFQRK